MTNLFNGNAKCVKDSFGGDAIRETSSRRKPDFVPFLEYKMDSNENFSCHSVISRFKCTKHQFLSDQCRVPLSNDGKTELILCHSHIELKLK